MSTDITVNGITLKIADGVWFQAETAAQILTKLLTVDGAGSGLDADTLDGQHASGLSLTSSQISDFTAAVEEVMFADATAHGTRSTSGDGTAVIAAPGAGSYLYIVGAALTVDDPGTDEVTVIIKSGSTEVYKITIDAEAVGVAILPPLVCGTNEAVYVNLSDAVNVNYTLSYKTRTA